jgi:hypothetical protein
VQLLTLSLSLNWPRSFWVWAAASLLAVPLALIALVTYWLTYTPIPFGDADWYATALPALTSDAPLYDPSKLGPHPLQRPVFWDQAPSTALFALLLLLPGGPILWGLVMAASLFGGLAIVWPRIGVATLVAAPALLVWFPVTSAIAWANINSLVFLMLAIAWRFPRAAGWAIGIAAAAKLIPILGVFWLAGRRDWRGAAIALAIPIVATAVVLAWKGPDTLIDFITLRANQWNPEQGLRWGLVQATGMSPAAALGMAGTVALVAYRRASFTLAVMAMLVSIPVMHAHYLTWMLVPLLGATARPGVRRGTS